MRYLFLLHREIPLTHANLGSLDEKKAQVVVEEIKAFGGDAIVVCGDVSADEFPKKILDAAISRYGKLNHIVNNGLCGRIV